ncbi:hypothetical protein GCM10007425_09010 [Lysinibacillus alkalisoli]|uniref:Uncharacterized protein n=1 Tax=Lysinibacillus alkalisoli TaxID=1911548 RepID=A0A917G0L5_9BACI|nr:hypothetical protein GCM10007425_09010 [Lysinibacillus alkalisoli]
MRVFLFCCITYKELNDYLSNRKYGNSPYFIYTHLEFAYLVDLASIEKRTTSIFEYEKELYSILFCKLNLAKEKN